jgi:HK97 gp10 family phage protein
VSFQLDGMQELMRRVEQMELRVNTQLKDKTLKEGAELMKEKIIDYAPERTGKLKDSIAISGVRNDEIEIGPDQQGTGFYGHFLEFGTSKMSPQPFMGPAFENHKDEAQEKMKDVIKRELGL